MEFILNIVSDMIATLLSTGIILLIGYLFRDRVRRFLKGGDVLSARALPQLKFEVSNVGMWDATGKPLTMINIYNVGEIGVSRVRFFYYSMKENFSKIAVTPIKHENQPYKSGRSDGEMVNLHFSDIHEVIGFNSLKEGIHDSKGFYVEFYDERGILFVQKAYLEKKAEKFDLCFQSLVRPKKRLPNRPFSIPSIKLKEKYNIDISVG